MYSLNQSASVRHRNEPGSRPPPLPHPSSSYQAWISGTPPSRQPKALTVAAAATFSPCAMWPPSSGGALIGRRDAREQDQLSLALVTRLQWSREVCPHQGNLPLHHKSADTWFFKLIFIFSIFILNPLLYLHHFAEALARATYISA